MIFMKLNKFLVFIKKYISFKFIDFLANINNINATAAAKYHTNLFAGGFLLFRVGFLRGVDRFSECMRSNQQQKQQIIGEQPPVHYVNYRIFYCITLLNTPKIITQTEWCVCDSYQTCQKGYNCIMVKKHNKHKSTCLRLHFYKFVTTVKAHFKNRLFIEGRNLTAFIRKKLMANFKTTLQRNEAKKRNFVNKTQTKVFDRAIRV